MGLLNLGVPEAAEAELDHGAIVQDLGQGVGVVDGILNKWKKIKDFHH